MKVMKGMFIALVFGALMLSIAACGGQGSGPGVQSSASYSTARASAEGGFDYASITYEGWQLDFANAVVVWSEQDESDVIQVPARFTYNGDQESSVFANLDNFLAFPGNAEDDYLDVSIGVNEEGESLHSIDAEAGETKPGESIEVVYGWVLDGNYGDIRLDIQGYEASDDETSVTFHNVEQTDKCRVFEQTARTEPVEKKDAGEADITGAVIAKPIGWYFENAEEKSAELKKEDGSGGSVEVSYQTDASSAGYDRAVEHADNHGFDASAVQSAIVNGIEWFYFESADDQFAAFATAGDAEVLCAESSSFSWNDATEVIGSITQK